MCIGKPVFNWIRLCASSSMSGSGVPQADRARSRHSGSSLFLVDFLQFVERVQRFAWAHGIRLERIHSFPNGISCGWLFNSKIETLLERTLRAVLLRFQFAQIRARSLDNVIRYA